MKHYYESKLQPASAAKRALGLLAVVVGSLGAPGGAIAQSFTLNLTLTPTLVLSYASLPDNGSAFDCVATNSCSASQSNPAGLSVAWACPADFDHSGKVTVQDLFEFLEAWFAGCP